MPYDFAHPKFNRGFVEIPKKEEPLFDKFCSIAKKYRVNVLRNQMIVSTKDYTGKIFNRFSYIEVRSNGKSTILKNELDIDLFFSHIK